MAKQWMELEKMVIPKGKRESNAISLHPRTGTVATITIYAPTAPSSTDSWLCVSADGTAFVTFAHRGQIVKLPSSVASDIPLPACKLMRVESFGEVDEDRTFQVLALLEVD